MTPIKMGVNNQLLSNLYKFVSRYTMCPLIQEYAVLISTSTKKHTSEILPVGTF